MPLPIPQLDDRSYQDLVDGALARIKDDLHTDWNDLSPGDPGVVLLEAFAFLTEQMIYRLNRVPEKAYIAFLNMLGVGLKPPQAASVMLSFWQETASGGVIKVPRGTMVTSEPKGGEAVIFTTVEDLDVPPESNSQGNAKRVIAYNMVWEEEELPTKGSGLPGQVFMVKRPPILGRTDRLELQLGVEVTKKSEWRADDWIIPEEPGSRKIARRFQVWEEVPNFADLDPDSRSYRVDRQTGTIQFAPAAYLTDISGKLKTKPQSISNEKRAMAAVPPEGRLIRVRYPTGGGASGNIPPGVLVSIEKPADLKGKLKVTNLEAARGGMEAETLENALVRGPQEVFTQERLITKRDFERGVLRSWPSIARASAYALQELWEHAVPGTVSISLVPRLDGSVDPTAITKEELESEQAKLDSSKDQAADELEPEKPLGTNIQLDWTRYKRVTVKISAIVPQGVGTEDVRKRLQDMLYRTICPLPQPAAQGQEKSGEQRKGVPAQNGWGFGEELRLADVLRWIFASDENIKRLPTLELVIDSAPGKNNEGVASLVADYYQASTWYATSGKRLFRTTNDAAGWEELLDFSPGMSNPSLHLGKQGEAIPDSQSLKKVCPSRYKVGLVALAGLADPKKPTDPLRSYVYLSMDCGENWIRLADIDAEIDDMDWLQRAGQHILLLATSKGLQEVHIEFDIHGSPRLEDSYLIPIIDNNNVTLPVYAVKVLVGKGGTARVAVAMAGRKGVYLSGGVDLKQRDVELNQPATFKPLTTNNTDLIPPDIRCLGLQWSEQDDRFLLWAGGMALGPKALGCCCWVLDEQLNIVKDQPLYLQNGETGRWFKEGWVGGSCLGLAFLGNRVLAATARGSILVADVKPPIDGTAQEISAWQTFSEQEDQENNLPVSKMRIEIEEPPGPREYPPFTAIASNDRLKNQQLPLPVVLVGCGEGVFRSQDEGVSFEKVSRDTFRHMNDSVTIPRNWLLVSGQHDIQVKEENRAGDAGSTASGLNGEEQKA